MRIKRPKDQPRYSGKCQIKSGSYLDMFELKAELDDLSLNVQIEEYAGDMQ